MLYLDSKPEAKLIPRQLNQSQMNQLIQSSLLMNGLNGSELLVTPLNLCNQTREQPVWTYIHTDRQIDRQTDRHVDT